MIFHENNAFKFIDWLYVELYVVDGFANWDVKNRCKIRVIWYFYDYTFPKPFHILSSTAYHALFMQNMLIRPTADELKDFGKPDFFM